MQIQFKLKCMMTPSILPSLVRLYVYFDWFIFISWENQRPCMLNFQGWELGVKKNVRWGWFFPKTEKNVFETILWKVGHFWKAALFGTLWLVTYFIKLSLVHWINIIGLFTILEPPHHQGFFSLDGYLGGKNFVGENFRRWKFSYGTIFVSQQKFRHLNRIESTKIFPENIQE